MFSQSAAASLQGIQYENVIASLGLISSWETRASSVRCPSHKDVRAHGSVDAVGAMSMQSPADRDPDPELGEDGLHPL
jgi:hypothetical protein